MLPPPEKSRRLPGPSPTFSTTYVLPLLMTTPSSSNPKAAKSPAWPRSTGAAILDRENRATISPIITRTRRYSRSHLSVIGVSALVGRRNIRTRTYLTHKKPPFDSVLPWPPMGGESRSYPSGPSRLGQARWAKPPPLACRCIGNPAGSPRTAAVAMDRAPPGGVAWGGPAGIDCRW